MITSVGKVIAYIRNFVYLAFSDPKNLIFKIINVFKNYVFNPNKFSPKELYEIYIKKLRDGYFNENLLDKIDAFIRMNKTLLPEVKINQLTDLSKEKRVVLFSKKINDYINKMNDLDLIPDEFYEILNHIELNDLKDFVSENLYARFKTHFFLYACKFIKTRLDLLKKDKYNLLEEEFEMLKNALNHLFGLEIFGKIFLDQFFKKDYKKINNLKILLEKLDALESSNFPEGFDELMFKTCLGNLLKSMDDKTFGEAITNLAKNKYQFFDERAKFDIDVDVLEEEKKSLFGKLILKIIYYEEIEKGFNRQLFNLLLSEPFLNSIDEMIVYSKSEIDTLEKNRPFPGREDSDDESEEEKQVATVEHLGVEKKTKKQPGTKLKYTNQSILPTSNTNEKPNIFKREKNIFSRFWSKKQDVLSDIPKLEDFSDNDIVSKLEQCLLEEFSEHDKALIKQFVEKKLYSLETQKISSYSEYNIFLRLVKIKNLNILIGENLFKKFITNFLINACYNVIFKLKNWDQAYTLLNQHLYASLEFICEKTNLAISFGLKLFVNSNTRMLNLEKILQKENYPKEFEKEKFTEYIGKVCKSLAPIDCVSLFKKEALGEKSIFSQNEENFLYLNTFENEEEKFEFYSLLIKLIIHDEINFGISKVKSPFILSNFFIESLDFEMKHQIQVLNDIEKPVLSEQTQTFITHPITS